MPNKPTKWGIKLWCVADASQKYVYDFEVYTGASVKNMVSQAGPGEAKTGYEVVLSLMSGLHGRGHMVFMDNFFTSVKLLMSMVEKGTYGTRTMRSNRKDLPQAMADKTLWAKMPQGTFGWRMHSSRKISCVTWVDKIPCFCCQPMPIPSRKILIIMILSLAKQEVRERIFQHHMYKKPTPNGWEVSMFLTSFEVSTHVKSAATSGGTGCFSSFSTLQRWIVGLSTSFLQSVMDRRLSSMFSSPWTLQMLWWWSGAGEEDAHRNSTVGLGYMDWWRLTKGEYVGNVVPQSWQNSFVLNAETCHFTWGLASSARSHFPLRKWLKRTFSCVYVTLSNGMLNSTIRLVGCSVGLTLCCCRGTAFTVVHVSPPQFFLSSASPPSLCNNPFPCCRSMNSWTCSCLLSANSILFFFICL